MAGIITVTNIESVKNKKIINKIVIIVSNK